MHRGIIAPILLVIVFFAGIGFAAVYFQSKSKPTITQSPSTYSSPAEQVPSSDETVNWKIYTGKYFSFKYPAGWTDDTGPTMTYPENLDVIGLIISQNTVFEASYKNYSYEKEVQNFAGRQSKEMVVAGRKSIRFDLQGSGDVLPAGFSVISILVTGSENSSYVINFNGDRRDIPDELIDQILSTFKFLD